MRPARDPGAGFHGMLGRSPAMILLYERIRTIACSDAPVLIRGESGVGKGLAAWAIHAAAPRAACRFVRCRAESLAHLSIAAEAGSNLIPGAWDVVGRCTQRPPAQPEEVGTVLLDEIGDLAPCTQDRLLRYLEVRAGKGRPGDGRLIFTSNQDLENLSEQGRFRQDLLDRLTTLTLEVPPLRERMDDLLLLVPEFMRRIGIASGKRISGLGMDAMTCFLHHSWPGNCRELLNAIEYGSMLCEEGGMIRADHLPAPLAPQSCPCGADV